MELNVVEGSCQALSNVELSGIVAMCDAGKEFSEIFSILLSMVFNCGE